VLDGDSPIPLFLALSHAAEDETSVLLISYAPQVSTSATAFVTLDLTDIFLSSRVFVFLW
jgi:hypothetical protein